MMKSQMKKITIILLSAPMWNKKDTREVIDIDKLNAEIKQTVANIDRLRAEIDKIVTEIEG